MVWLLTWGRRRGSQPGSEIAISGRNLQIWRDIFMEESQQKEQEQQKFGLGCNDEKNPAQSRFRLLQLQ